MCIGDNRHYRMHQVAPRHFVQTADTCGLPVGTATDVMQELAVDLPKALETSINDMPDGFPAALIESIQAGALNRLEAVRQAIN